MPGIAELFRLRPRNIRARLFRDLALVILLTTGAVIVLAATTASRAERSTARAHIEGASVQARGELARRLEPVDRRLKLVREWGKAELLDVRDRPGMLAKLAPVLEPLPMVTALIIADSQGNELHLSRAYDERGAPTGWWTRTRGLPKGKGRLLRERWSPDRELLDRAWIDMPGYVPMEQPWFADALENPAEGEVSRTVPYRFFELGQLGVTAAVRWTPDDGNTNVVAFDLLLGDVFAVVSEIEVSEGSETFLCDSGARVFLPYRSPAPGETPSGPQHVFVDAAETGNALIQSAVLAWKRAGSTSEEAVSFCAEDVCGWAGFRLVDPQSGIWLGVAVPNPEIFGADIEWTPQVIAALGSILLLGIVLAVSLVRKYGHQLRDVPKQLVSPKTFDRDIRKLIARGEGPTLEFKSTVRMNLKSGKSGKEIELAWLKGATAFMNTDGGTLLIGVRDDGEILGLQPDGFENEDRCRLHLKNLVNQHIGAELSPLIRFEVGTVDEKAIAVVQCERSPKPVFLKAKNRELFYVRSGPSSVELSSREVLDYVARRA